jgi:hypothetical protein
LSLLSVDGVKGNSKSEIIQRSPEEGVHPLKIITSSSCV